MFVYFKHVCIFDSTMKQNTKTMANEDKKGTSTRPVLSNEVIGALADAFGKSTLTIQRWVNADSILLTTETAKKVFAEKNIEWS
jgi:hypothetical protein